MGKYSREKGKRFERQLANTLTAYGFPCRRGVQYSGRTGEADDVVGLKGIHIEAKNVERLNIWDAMEQAERDANENEYPAVFHTKNRKGVLVSMRLEDWIEIYREWVKNNGE